MHVVSKNNIKTTWPEGGSKYTSTKEPAYNRAIKDLEWQAISKDHTMIVPVHNGIAINKVIMAMKLPKVSRIAVDSKSFHPYYLYGVTCHYSNGQVDLYLIDSGVDCTIVRCDQHEMEIDQESLILKWIEMASKYDTIAQAGAGSTVPFGRGFFYECTTVENLKISLVDSNACVGQAYFHANLCFINTCLAPNHWLCFRDNLQFDKLSFPGETVKDRAFEKLIESMLRATKEDLIKGTY